MERRISLITLGVTDLERSVDFYRDVVGWKPTSHPGEVAFLDLGGVILALWTHEALAADLGMDPAVGPYRAVSLAYNARSRDEVDAIFERVRGGGAVITKAPAETSWGGYSGYFADPDGHQWEVAHNPFWTIREDGRIDLPSDDPSD